MCVPDIRAFIGAYGMPCLKATLKGLGEIFFFCDFLEKAHVGSI